LPNFSPSRPRLCIGIVVASTTSSSSTTDPAKGRGGRTLGDAFVIRDEAQNGTHEQLKRFVTRLGANSKMIVTGDDTQIDLPGVRSGLLSLEPVLLGVPDEMLEEYLNRPVDFKKLLPQLSPQFEVAPNCYFVPAEAARDDETVLIYLGDLPRDAPRTAPDAWHERDVLLLVLSDDEGRIIGYMSVDGPLDVVPGHVHPPCPVHREPKPKVGVRIAAALFRGQHDFFGHFGENHAALDVRRALLALDLAPL